MGRGMQLVFDAELDPDSVRDSRPIPRRVHILRHSVIFLQCVNLALVLWADRQLQGTRALLDHSAVESDTVLTICPDLHTAYVSFILVKTHSTKCTYKK